MNNKTLDIPKLLKKLLIDSEDGIKDLIHSDNLFAAIDWIIDMQPNKGIIYNMFQKPNMQFVDPDTWKQEAESSLDKLNRIAGNLVNYNNGAVVQYMLMSTIINWKNLFNLCAAQLMLITWEELGIKITIEDAKNCIRYISKFLDKDPEFVKLYNDCLQKYRF